VESEASAAGDEQAQLLTAIYRPESKAAWREELRAANAQAEKARERSASLSSTSSASSTTTAIAPGDASGGGKTDEEQLQSISLAVPADDEAQANANAQAGADDGQRSWTLRKVLKSHLDIVRSVSFASGPHVLLASGGDDCTVKIWSLLAHAQRHPQ
jgi:striatin 1/3/4